MSRLDSAIVVKADYIVLAVEYFRVGTKAGIARRSLGK